MPCCKLGTGYTVEGKRKRDGPQPPWVYGLSPYLRRRQHTMGSSPMLPGFTSSPLLTSIFSSLETLQLTSDTKIWPQCHSLAKCFMLLGVFVSVLFPLPRMNFNHCLPGEPLPTSSEINRDMTSSRLCGIKNDSFSLFCSNSSEFGPYSWPLGQ